MAITVVAMLESASPLSMSKHYSVEKLTKESDGDYEKRTWRERLHYDEKGIVMIPPMAIKNTLAEAARWMGMKIPGKRSATYTKHFEAGVLCMKGISLGIHKDEVQSELLFVPSDGKRGGARRVEKLFPLIPRWAGPAEFVILDRTITKEVFKAHLDEAGRFIGFLRFRPRQGGFYGRFDIKKITWQDSELSKN
jgi:hypothetical protein